MSDSLEDAASRVQARNEAIRAEIARLRRFIDTLQHLVEAMDAGYGNDRVMSALSESLERALEAIDAQGASLLVLDEDTAELVFVLVAGDLAPESLAWHRIPAQSGIAGWVADRGEPLIVNDARRDERFYAAVDEEVDFVTESVMAVPVIARGKVIGVLEIVNKGAHGMFTEEDQTLVSLMSRFAGELLHRISEKESERGAAEPPAPD